MHYDCIKEGIFLARPNRFIAHVYLDGQTVVCHVKNTGRCRELLIPGVFSPAGISPKDAPAKGRKTAYSLIGVYKRRKTVLLISHGLPENPNQYTGGNGCNAGS